MVELSLKRSIQTDGAGKVAAQEGTGYTIGTEAPHKPSHSTVLPSIPVAQFLSNR